MLMNGRREGNTIYFIGNNLSTRDTYAREGSVELRNCQLAIIFNLNNIIGPGQRRLCICVL